jgi:hypothetical protein
MPDGKLQHMEGKTIGQRIILAAILLIGVIYAYFAFLVVPLEASAVRLRKRISEAQAQSSVMLQEARTLNEEAAAQDRPELDAAAERLLAAIPTSHRISTPATVTELIEKHDLGKGQIRLGFLSPLAGQADLLQAGWTIRVSQSSARRIGEFIADLENAFPVGEMSEVILEASSATGTVDATLTLQLLVHP